jgi:hypothetical protein
MRRLFALLAVFGMLFALPVAAANAQDDRFEADIYSSADNVGTTADGATVWQGGFLIDVGGVTVETGLVRYTVYENEDASAIHYRALYRDDSTGNIVRTTGEGSLVEVDEVNGVLTFALTERIVSSTDGVSGHAEGYAYVQLDENGVAVSVEALMHWIISPPDAR